MTGPKYRYDHLNLPGSIRLLQLQPGIGEELISCLLVESSLEHSPQYEAVSYTWGDAADREEIKCGSCRLSITRSLANALRHMRFEHDSRILWADAICIDQDNIAERNQQVSMMRRIYSDATRVLIWLGPRTDESVLAIDFISDLAALQCEFNSVPHPTKCAEHELDNVLATEIDSSQYQEAFGAVGIQDRLAIMKFFRHPWFRRAWVIQEVTRGNAVTVICGQTTMNWKIFALGGRVLGFCLRYNRLWPSRQVHPETMIGITHLCSTLSRLSWLQNVSFAEMLHYTSNYDATDPRDKIYALLGCSSNETVNTFPIDYHLSMEGLMTRINPLLYEERGRLDPLIYAQHESEICTDRPSWTPDLDALRDTMPIITPQREKHQKRFGGIDAKLRVKGNQMIVTGQQVGGVASVSGPTSILLEEDRLWQWHPTALDWAVRNFVMNLAADSQPSAFRSLVRACTLNQSSSHGEESLDGDKECDENGKLFLAAIFYYSFTNTPPPAPSYLSVDSSSEWRKYLYHSTSGRDVPLGRTVYEEYNISDQFDPEKDTADDQATRLATVYRHYGIDDAFDEAALDRLQSRIFQACSRRRLFVLEDDEAVIGIGPGGVKAGDVVVQLTGALTPFVLRPFGESYQYVGECFIHGEMPGDAKALDREAAAKSREFVML